MNKTQWVRENLPVEFHSAYGELLACLLTRADLGKLAACLGHYTLRIQRETEQAVRQEVR